ncbi:MAG: hypothetical protein VCA18_06280 [Opitutales bacterium]
MPGNGNPLDWTGRLREKTTELPVIMLIKTALERDWERYPRLKELAESQRERIESNLGGFSSIDPRAGDDLKNLLEIAIVVLELEFVPPPPPPDGSSLESAKHDWDKIEREVYELSSRVNYLRHFMAEFDQKSQDMLGRGGKQFSDWYGTQVARLRKEGKDRL